MIPHFFKYLIQTGLNGINVNTVTGGDNEERSPILITAFRCKNKRVCDPGQKPYAHEWGFSASLQWIVWRLHRGSLWFRPRFPLQYIYHHEKGLYSQHLS